MSGPSEAAGFKDHFSAHAADYAAARPGYPPELFAWIASATPDLGTAWDCATGNGQAARGLAGYFERVFATDASAEQIARARPDPRIDYRVAPAESPGLAPKSVAAVTVAQAIHWFEHERFFPAVRRALRPNGLVAVWCYGLFSIDPALDELFESFYEGPVGAFWPPERRLIDERYATLEFPFEELDAPEFRMRHRWSLARVLAYLRTWSAVQRYRARNGADPVEALVPELLRRWGSEETRDVVWPLYLRAGICR